MIEDRGDLPAVLSLNYHEVTEDARVFKQARALVARGHRVAVMCRRLADRERTESVDGVEVVRFECFSHDRVRETDPDLFPFLQASRPLMEARYLPYARAAERSAWLARARAWAEERFEATESALASAPVAALASAGPVRPSGDGISDPIAADAALRTMASALSPILKELRALRRDLKDRIRASGRDRSEVVCLRERFATIDKSLREWAGLRTVVRARREELATAIERLPPRSGPQGHETNRAHDLARRHLCSAKDARSWIRADHRARTRERAERFRELYQCLSIVFAVNLMRETLPFTPDVIHAHDFYTLPGAIVLARRTGAHVLYDAHEYEPGRASKMPPEGNQLVDLMERDCLVHVDRMTTVSPSIADLYARRFPGPSPDLVMNTPDICIESPRAAEAVSSSGRLRELAGLGSDARIIAFTGGTQRENRGLDKLCHALAELPNFHLVALGQRHERDDAWLMNHAREAGVEDRVVLLLPVDAREVVPTIADADLSICVIQDAGTSYRYALPNKLFEAAFARLPIVVSNLPEMRRFVEAFGIGRATDQTDPRAIARTIREVVATRDSYLMSPSRIDQLVSQYSWRSQEERLAGIVRELAARPRRAI